METINAPKFGYDTKIKKIRLQTKKLKAHNEIMDLLIQALLFGQALVVTYVAVNWVMQ